MTYFEPRTAEAEIGSKGFQQIQRLVDRHYPRAGGRLFRAAPSIVCRSELELLSVAAPRFAYRTPLQSKGGRGFLNCRRLSLLGKQLESALPTRWDVAQQRLEALDAGDFDNAVKQLRERVEGSSPIAESVLPPPNSCEDYHVIARDYSQLFGESDPIFGTPFVNAIELGGGVCAQGACFMGSLLRIDDTAFVHGPSEITAVLQGSLDAGSLTIRGFQFGEFVKFFRDPRVGLNSYLESLSIPPETAEDLDIRPERENSELQLIGAIRSYLLSNVPIIVLLDTRAYCETVLARNNIRVERLGSSSHCILLVGTRHEAGSLDLLALDPTVSVPWLRLSIHELAECRIRRRQGAHAPAVTLYPVLPPGVNTHLLYAEGEATVGLLRVAHLVQWHRAAARWNYPDLDDSLPTFQGYNRLAEFHLTDLARVRAGQLDVRAVDFCRGDAALLQRVARSLPATRWVWLQRGVHYDRRGCQSLWVWDAERKITGNGSLAEHLPLVARDGGNETGGDWETIWPATRGQRVGTAGDDPDRQHDSPTRQLDLAGLKVALISSFLPRRACKVKPFWPKLADGSPVACEFYGFMLPDQKPIVSRLRAKLHADASLEPMSLHELLDWIGQAADRVREVADYVHESYSLESAPIIGIASYIPELSQPPGSHASKMAIASLRCLCQLAIELRTRHQHPVSTIELVGGSRVVGVDWKRLLNDMRQHPSPDLSIITESPETTRSWLADAIRASVENLEDRLEKEGISLALELEPGELYVLNDLVSVRQLIESMDLPILGLNMDIGHFLMSRHLHPDLDEWNAQLEHMKPWLCHCHVSRHSLAGHFGDNPLPDPQAITWEMRELLHVYADALRTRSPPREPYVSVELEAAADIPSVCASVQSLAQVIKSN